MAKNIFRYVPAAAVLFLPLLAASQNLNPTVEVSRQYRGTMMELEKPSVGMALPDSVMKFDLEFDYSVFDSPFKGAYEFRPYLTDMELSPAVSPDRKLYLRAGAGYSLHPVLDLVWSPVRNEKFRLSVFGSHRSYIGNYRALGAEAAGAGISIARTGTGFYGYDMLSKAGVDGSYDWDSGVFSFRAGYYGTALKDTVLTRGFNAFDLDMKISSKLSPESHYVYDVELGYRFADDGFRYAGAEKDHMLVHDIDFSASMGGTFRSGHTVLVDMDFDMAAYGGAYASSAGSIAFTPRYLYSSGRWNLDLGVRLAFLFRDNRPGSPAQMNMTKGQVVYPDLKISFAAIRRHMDIYLTAGGGPDINRYSSLLSRNRHIAPLYNSVVGAPLLDNTVERISAAVGLKGSIASRLDYDLKAGYRNFGNAPLEVVAAGPDRLYPGLAYAAWQMFFARMECSWTSQDVRAGGWLQYQATDAAGKNDCLIAPAALTGYLDFVYNWKERIYVGVDCGFSTARKGLLMNAAPSAAELKVPGYADLGISAEYAFTRKFSLWLRGGNLLDMTIQHTPLYAASGIYFTAGICLNL